MGILWKLEEYAAQRNANSAKKTANSIPLMHLRRLVNGKKRYFLWKPNMRIFIAHTGRYDLSSGVSCSWSSATSIEERMVHPMIPKTTPEQAQTLVHQSAVPNG